MLSIIEKALATNMDYMLEHSYRNCHVMGLYSIVLSEDREGNLTRLFYADRDHQLWKNDVSFLYRNPMSLGIHCHGKDLYFQVLGGSMINILAKESGEGVIMGKYKFDSKINGGTGGFSDQQLAHIEIVAEDAYEKGDSFKMASDEMHTVFVEHNTAAVWSIVEANPSVAQKEKFTYSNHDLTKIEIQPNMYNKFASKDHLESVILDLVKII